MQMIRSHIQNRETERKINDKIDLDERIRQIREKNKTREKRFKEIEDDKLSALSDGGCVAKSDQKKHWDNDRQKDSVSMPSAHLHREKASFAMPGMLNGRKLGKGRGQRLLEMSKEPLKAKAFESKSVYRDKLLKDKQHQKTYQRRNGSTRGPIGDRVGTTGGILDRLHDEDKLHKYNSGWKSTQDKSCEYWNKEIMIIPVDKVEELSIENAPEIVPVALQNVESCSNTFIGKDIGKAKKTTDIIDHNYISFNEEKTIFNIDKNILESDSDEKLPKHLENNALLGTNNSMKGGDSEAAVSNNKVAKQYDRPNITVKITKTASTASFDEVMSMLSPLDVPSNWGDCPFDEDLEPITF